MRFCGQTCLPLEIYDFPALPAELFSIRQLYDAFDVSSAVFADDGFPADQLGAVGTAFQMAGRRFRIIQTENDDDGDDAQNQAEKELQKCASVFTGSRYGADHGTAENDRNNEQFLNADAKHTQSHAHTRSRRMRKFPKRFR